MGNALDSSVGISVLQTRNIVSGKTFFKFFLGASTCQTRSCIKEKGNHRYKDGEEEIILFRVDDAQEILIQLFKVELLYNDVLVAHTLIPLNQFQNNRIINWYILQDEKGQSAGEVYLSIIYKPLHDEKKSLNKMTIADVVLLRKVFFVFESFGAGKNITKVELGAAFKARGMDFTDDELQQMIAECDTAGIKDGTIDFAEFLSKSTGIPKSKMTQIREDFDAIDTDKEGFITQEELGFFLWTKKIDLSDEKLKVIIRTAESVSGQDGTGKFEKRIDFIGFLVLMLFDHDLRHSWK